jgi:predicted XRE-type DNA-binding protein
MNSLKIKKTYFDNRKHLIWVETSRGAMSLPFKKLTLKPTRENPIQEIYSDKELGNLAVTYILLDGSEDSIPSDAFLDYNCDPTYLRTIELHKLTIEANKALERSGLSKREVSRRLNTSMSQLLRLLDASNTKKTIDQMFKLLAILGAKVEIKVAS